MEDSHLLPYQPWKWKSHCRDLAWKELFTLSLLVFSSISSIHESSSFIQKVVEISKENSVLSNSHLHAGIALWWWSGPLRREVRGQELSACGGDFMREEIVFSGKIQLSLNKSQCKAKITMEELNLLVTEGQILKRFQFLNPELSKYNTEMLKYF